VSGMSKVSLSRLTVEIPLRGVLHKSGSDPRIIERGRRNVYVRALHDITFEAVSGDRIGIVGSNGAGKSTLLRTIAGLLPPSSGTLTISGSLHGIFSLSDGMRLALTGRENARLQYYLLGEPGGSFEAFISDVESFADLGDFFELPLSTYSPGMMSRLLFAMGTFKHADILLLDEWIGVSDRSFQEKAAQRLHDLVDRYDILFIATHDRNILAQVTEKTIILENGELRDVMASKDIG
jgi:ABC-type polysaccharide/polyol phosphate transport system ATPase subunit